MKKISVLIPCFNEEENVVPISQAIIEQFEKYLPQYDYEIIFIDNDSQDSTRAKLTGLCGDIQRQEFRTVQLSVLRNTPDHRRLYDIHVLRFPGPGRPDTQNGA